MSPTVLSLLGYIGWMLLLLFILLMVRIHAVVKKRKAPNSFDPTGVDVSPFAVRLTRVHANCYEHFPIFGGLMLLALALDWQHLTDGLALWLLGARLAQGTVHMISTQTNAVRLRLLLFLVQYGIAVTWMIQALRVVSL